MQVSGINSVKYNNISKQRLSVESTQMSAKPSFGWLLSGEEAALLKKYLTPERMASYSQRMLKLSTMATQKTVKASDSRDEILKIALREAKFNRFKANVKNFIDSFLNLPQIKNEHVA